MTTGGREARDAVVTIRHRPAARAATGRDGVRLTGHPFGDVLEAAAAAHAGLRVVLWASTNLGRPEPGDGLPTVVRGATLEVLPPFAGR